MNIFFDVDGVLIHSYRGDRSRQETWDHNIEADLGVPRNAFQKALFGTKAGDEEPLFHSVLRGELPLEDALAIVLPQIGVDVEASTLIAYWLAQDSSINDELFSVVDKLCDVPDISLFLATAQEHHRARYLWHNLEFRRYFRKMYYAADLGLLKDSPDFFTKIERLLTHDFVDVNAAGGLLFFDDRQDIVEHARNAGWDAYLYQQVSDVTDHPRLKLKP